MGGDVWWAFFCFIVFALIFPSIVFLGGYAFGGGWEDARSGGGAALGYGVELGFWLGSFFFLLGFGVWYRKHSKLESMIPTRFNRQRREVCFVPEGGGAPIFVPWEELVAWITEAQGFTEYGIQRQYGFGVGFFHPGTGKKYTLEFETYGQPQAISTWEAIRAYMEYEVHTLKEIQDPLDLQGPDDPPWEGVHVFRNARKRAHDRYREGDVGLFYLVGWYLYHMMTFWTVPNRLVEWEAKKLSTMNCRAMPETMQRWSEPLSESQWAKPCDELKRQSERVRELLKAHPAKSTLEIFEQVSDEFDAKASLTA